MNKMFIQPLLTTNLQMFKNVLVYAKRKYILQLFLFCNTY